MNIDNEICPSCGNTKNNFFMGSGFNFVLYYHCASCGHDFVINGAEYLQDEERLELIDELYNE